MANQNLTVPIYSTGGKMTIKVRRNLAEINSDFQELLFVDTFDFGKCLLIDGVVQCSDADHKLYDKEILKKLSSRDRNIAIIGGGDGYVAEMALKLNPKLKIRIIDLDIAVVNGSRKYLGQKIFSNKKVRLFIEDALRHLAILAKRNKIKMDGIIFDLTDEPVRKKDKDAKASFIKFYAELIDASHQILKKGGWLSLQAGASKVIPKYNNAVAILKKLLKRKFKKVERTDIMIPSFGEKNAFLFGEK